MPVLQGPPNRACYRHTCAIQRCLADNNFDTKSCAWEINALKRCCEQPYAAGSIHCAFPDIKHRTAQREADGEREKPTEQGEEQLEERSSEAMAAEEAQEGAEEDTGLRRAAAAAATEKTEAESLQEVASEARENKQ